MLRVLNGDDMYSTMTIAAQDGLKLKVVEAKFADSEIIVLLRELGTGKTAFIRLLVLTLLTIMRLQGPDHVAPLPYQSVGILREDTDDATLDPLFVTEVMEPLQIEQLMDRMVFDLSREEAQRVALCVCLEKIYLIDEPSAYLSPNSVMLPQEL
ncbi:ABC transporter E family member 2 [Tanacetum coccineum]